VDGILNVDKPLGMTSHDVVVAIRRMAGRQSGVSGSLKVGHAGTLDPLATGVLLVCLGRATRVSEYLMRSAKTYRATLELGVTTTTHDAEGEVTSCSQVDVRQDDVLAALPAFTGSIQQVPPRYSAIKRGGRPLYELARRGIEVDVPAREVEVYALDLVAWEPPHVVLDVRCGPGTYVRALARDIGRALGCGAYLSALRRTSSGAFQVSEAVDLPTLRAAFEDGRVDEMLHPIEAAFDQLPVLHLDAEQAWRLATGQFVEGIGEPDTEDMARAHGPDDQFIALVRRDRERGSWRPHKVFIRPEELPPDPP
jgi:tRNA pseudouridine55 synthase